MLNLSLLEKLDLTLVGVGKKKFSKKYISIKNKTEYSKKRKKLLRVNISLLVLEK